MRASPEPLSMSLAADITITWANGVMNAVAVVFLGWLVLRVGYICRMCQEGLQLVREIHDAVVNPDRPPAPGPSWSADYEKYAAPGDYDAGVNNLPR